MASGVGFRLADVLLEGSEALAQKLAGRANGAGIDAPVDDGPSSEAELGEALVDLVGRARAGADSQT